MYLIELFMTRQRRTELSQSITRLVIVAVALFYLLIAAYFGHEFPSQRLVIWIAVALLIYAVGLNAAIRHSPEPLIWRRGLAMTIDLTAVSFVFHLAGSFGGVFYPIYFWIIVGNGLRFGVPYLYSATSIAVIGLSMAAISSDYWSQHVALTVGLIIGIIILPLFYAIILRELQAANEELQRQIDETAFAATHDSLTGLPNRFLFMDRLQQAIDRAQRNKNRFAILYIDLDKFKSINDSLGHAMGDSLLKNVGSRLRTTLRGTDSVARLGGDEFVLLLSDLMTRYNAHQAAQRIIQIFDVPFTIDGHELNVTSSVGISIFPDDADDIDNIIKCSDTAMYKAKNEGGHTFKSFSAISQT